MEFTDPIFSGRDVECGQTERQFLAVGSGEAEMRGHRGQHVRFAGRKEFAVDQGAGGVEPDDFPTH